MAHVIHLLNQFKEYFFVSIKTIQKFATCNNEFFYFKTLYLILSFDGKNYVTVENSKFAHRHTLGLGNYQGKALTTGCNYDCVSLGCIFSTCTSKVATELLDMTTLTWTDGPDYPFARSVSPTD